MAWDDTKTTLGSVTATEWNTMVGVIKSKPTVTTGTAAPISTPSVVGDMFVDTTNAKVYIATGTTSSADWKVMN
jgi:hypothetical protein